MSSPRIVANYRLARDEIFPRLMDARNKRQEPYDEPLVQDARYLPNFGWGSIKHAIYLFLLEIYMKGGITSNAAITQLTRLYNRHPELFDPFNFLDLSGGKDDLWMEKLEVALGSNGLGANIDDSKKTWVYNMHKLAKFWHGDPRLLFAEISRNAEKTWKSYRSAKIEYEKLCKVLIRNPAWSDEKTLNTPFGFWGFRHKMVSMLAYFYIHALMVNRFAYPVPVDFHILRDLISTEILKIFGANAGSEAYREKFLPYARMITLRYVVETKSDPQHLADCLWLLSRTFCRHHPGNKSSVEKTRRARRRTITELPVIWSEGNILRYDRTCGKCPIESFCKWNIPSSNYYVKGKIRYRSRRAKPPQMKLLDVAPVKIQRKSNPQIAKKTVVETSEQLSALID